MWFYFILLSQITTVKRGPEAGRVIPELKGKLVHCVNWKVTVGGSNGGILQSNAST